MIYGPRHAFPYDSSLRCDDSCRVRVTPAGAHRVTIPTLETADYGRRYMVVPERKKRRERCPSRPYAASLEPLLEGANRSHGPIEGAERHRPPPCPPPQAGEGIGSERGREAVKSPSPSPGW